MEVQGRAVIPSVVTAAKMRRLRTLGKWQRQSQLSKVGLGCPVKGPKSLLRWIYPAYGGSQIKLAISLPAYWPKAIGQAGSGDLG